jgi:hypothetical protein
VQEWFADRRVAMPSSGTRSGGAVTTIVVVSRRSRDEAPTASVNSPGSSTQPEAVIDQYDRSPASSRKLTVSVSASPGSSSIFAKALSSRGGLATAAAESPT